MEYAVIMAGGVGSRFWPRSRRARPKQFLNVFGQATLIQNTVARLQGLIPPERCLIVTNASYVPLVKQQLPAVPEENILAEPIGRNTAPCIEYAAVKLLARDPEAVMVVLPSDHLIENVRGFHETLRIALEKARTPSVLVTLGIAPTHPETGYGYIQFERTSHATPPSLKPYRVRTFAEKPDLATAERFLDSGDFLWNSGMFIWRADAIAEAIEHHLPACHAAFRGVRTAADTPEEAEALARAYRESPHISIDYGVMEHSGNVFVVPGSFGWNDVGDWRAVYELSEKDDHGNAMQGNVIMHDASRCLVQADHRLVVAVGIHDSIVVDTEDAVLVCSRESAQQVKNIVEYLKAHRLGNYL